jgi:hypothetical protein
MFGKMLPKQAVQIHGRTVHAHLAGEGGVVKLGGSKPHIRASGTWANRELRRNIGRSCTSPCSLVRVDDNLERVLAATTLIRKHRTINVQSELS